MNTSSATMFSNVTIPTTRQPTRLCGSWRMKCARSSTAIIPPVVVLSNPVIPRFANARDPEILLKEAIPLDQEAREMLQKKFILNRGLLIRDSGGPPSENVKGEQKPTAPGQQPISRII